jgi:hypothetical protein
LQTTRAKLSISKEAIMRNPVVVILVVIIILILLGVIVV